MPKGAVIYIRVSTAEQASSNQSLPVQESKARALCQQRGLSALKLFADKGESAPDDRPEFKKLMTYCRRPCGVREQKPQEIRTLGFSLRVEYSPPLP